MTEDRKLVNAIETAQRTIQRVRGDIKRSATLAERTYYREKLEEACITLEAVRVALRTR